MLLFIRVIRDIRVITIIKVIRVLRVIRDIRVTVFVACCWPRETGAGREPIRVVG
jgi:hypothetical protein